MAGGKVLPFERSGVGAQAEEADGSPPDVGIPPKSIEQMSAEVAGRLDFLLKNARTAANRLVNLPEAGVVPSSLKRELLNSFVELEAAIRTTADRLTNPGSTMDAQRDAERLEQQTQDYVQSVENTLAQAGVSEAAPKRKWNWWLIGAIGVGVGITGYAIWRAVRSTPKGTDRTVKLSGGAASKRKKLPFGGGVGKKPRSLQSSLRSSLRAGR